MPVDAAIDAVAGGDIVALAVQRVGVGGDAAAVQRVGVGAVGVNIDVPAEQCSAGGIILGQRQAKPVDVQHVRSRSDPRQGGLGDVAVAHVHGYYCGINTACARERSECEGHKTAPDSSARFLNASA